jgi:hypothetical protein
MTSDLILALLSLDACNQGFDVGIAGHSPFHANDKRPANTGIAAR